MLQPSEMPSEFLRRNAVEAMTGLSRSGIYDLMEKNNFPRPVRVGKKAVRWKSEEVRRWMDSRPVAD